MSGLEASIAYINGQPGILGLFNLILNRFSNPEMNRYNTLNLRPAVISNSLSYLDYSMFFNLKEGSQSLKYGKYIITRNSDPDSSWYRSSEETLSLYITTVKIILVCPGLLMYDPEIITQLVGFTLDNFTELGQVLTNVKPSALKEEIVKRLEDPIGFLENPEIGARRKGLFDFQVKLTSSLLPYLSGKN